MVFHNVGNGMAWTLYACECGVSARRVERTSMCNLAMCTKKVSHLEKICFVTCFVHLNEVFHVKGASNVANGLCKKYLCVAHNRTIRSLSNGLGGVRIHGELLKLILQILATSFLFYAFGSVS